MSLPVYSIPHNFGDRLRNSETPIYSFHRGDTDVIRLKGIDTEPCPYWVRSHLEYHTDPSMPGTRDLLHRVVFYGDHTEPIQRLRQLSGFEVAIEG